MTFTSAAVKSVFPIYESSLYRPSSKTTEVDMMISPLVFEASVTENKCHIPMTIRW